MTAVLLAFTWSIADEKPATLTPTDAKFIKQAAASGLYELKLAELGVKNAERPEVKAYAEMLVKDYSMINADLKSLATKKGIEFTDIQIDLKRTAALQDLEKIHKMAFDKAFLDETESAHKQILSEFEEESKAAKEADIITFVTHTLPNFRNHLDKLTVLKPAIKVSMHP